MCDIRKSGKIILIVWVVFSVIYVINGEWNRFKNYVAEKNYAEGRKEMVVQIITEAKKGCQPVPLFAGNSQVSVVNTDCLGGGKDNNSAGQPAAAQPAPVRPPVQPPVAPPAQPPAEQPPVDPGAFGQPGGNGQ
jgi:hypothetical protein